MIAVLRWPGAVWVLALLYVVATLPAIWLAITPQVLVPLAGAFLPWT